MRYKHVSSCPRCGAPIYEQQEIFDEGGIGDGPPVAHFTCNCRQTLPEMLPDVDGEALETTGQADRKHMARARKDAGEPDSEERVDDRH